ncbi:hypothetical protein J6590_019678 [Homalodisca vitripennis]|nr:hypothetical protein J6590_019678 [Homalodisca vitripennis]
MFKLVASPYAMSVHGPGLVTAFDAVMRRLLLYRSLGLARKQAALRRFLSRALLRALCERQHHLASNFELISGVSTNNSSLSLNLSHAASLEGQPQFQLLALTANTNIGRSYLTFGPIDSNKYVYICLYVYIMLTLYPTISTVAIDVLPLNRTAVSDTARINSELLLVRGCVHGLLSLVFEPINGVFSLQLDRGRSQWNGSFVLAQTVLRCQKTGNELCNGVPQTSGWWRDVQTHTDVGLTPLSYINVWGPLRPPIMQAGNTTNL